MRLILISILMLFVTGCASNLVGLKYPEYKSDTCPITVKCQYSDHRMKVVYALKRTGEGTYSLDGYGVWHNENRTAMFQTVQSINLAFIAIDAEGTIVEEVSATVFGDRGKEMPFSKEFTSEHKLEYVLFAKYSGRVSE